MMKFKKYQHVEKIGHRETKGIMFGKCFVFPKIDGTNASAWMRNGVMCFGSRNRQLTLDYDNGGFMEANAESETLKKFFAEYPEHRLFGEWLVPHTLKTYEDSAWRKFYVFDVLDHNGNYVPYDTYKEYLDYSGVDYIPPLAIINNPRVEDVEHYMNQNTFLIQDGKGSGEGVVLKNYDFKSENGKIRWAKFVRNNFRSENAKQFGVPVRATTNETEAKIIETFITQSGVDKVIAKLTIDSEWENKMMPQLLNTVFYELIQEEMWTIIKKFKNPVVDFGRLKGLSFQRTKELMTPNSP